MNCLLLLYRTQVNYGVLFEGTRDRLSRDFSGSEAR